MLRDLRGLRGAQEQLLLQFYSSSAFVALLPGLLRCLCRLLLPLSTFTAFVDFYCLSGLLLPLSVCCLACSAAFVYFYCLSGHGRLCLLRCLCPLLLPFSAFTAFVDLLPGLLRYTDFDYWMSQLADHINYSAFKLHLRIPTNSVPL